MIKDANGNFVPWLQPEYGHNAYGNEVTPPAGFEIVKLGEVIERGWMVFDVYSGWMKPDNYCADNKFHTRSNGRWTTWAKPTENI